MTMTLTMMMVVMVVVVAVVVVSKLALHQLSPFGHDLANSTSAQSTEVPLGSSECKVIRTCPSATDVVAIESNASTVRV